MWSKIGAKPCRSTASMRSARVVMAAACVAWRPGAIPPSQTVRSAAHRLAMTRRSQRPRAYAPDPDAPGRTCDMPGCTAAGEYRAPKSRDTLHDYWWYCLEHVRGYNATWDFYKGMSPGQIEAQLRADTAWQRPTWPLGRLGSRLDADLLRDPLHVLNAGRRATREAEERERGDEMPADMR